MQPHHRKASAGRLAQPLIQYAKTADELSIAFWSLGEGRPLVQMPSPPWSHIELEWQFAETRRWYERLARVRQLVRYDGRGTGLSARDVADYSLEAHLLDLAAVADHLDVERFDLLGAAEGCAVAVAYVVRHPQRVSRLVLQAPYAFSQDRGPPEVVRSLADLTRSNWGLARRTLADLVFPSGPIEAQRWFSDLLRDHLSPEMAACYMEHEADVDIRHLLPQVNAPTLVLQRRRDRVVPMRAGRAAAALIPNARFVALDGDIIIYAFGYDQYLELMLDFLGEGESAVVAAPSGLVTILFTDIEGSTALTQRLGDAKAQELLRTHNAIVREALLAHSGTEIKHTGDGIMASFGTASRAIESAVAIQSAVARQNQESPETSIRVRIGLNAGEPVAEEDDLFGAAVPAAARICARAQPGQILVSEVVRQLAAGKGFSFADKGRFALKGFPERFHLYEVRWREDQPT